MVGQTEYSKNSNLAMRARPGSMKTSFPKLPATAVRTEDGEGRANEGNRSARTLYTTVAATERLEARNAHAHAFRSRIGPHDTVNYLDIKNRDAVVAEESSDEEAAAEPAPPVVGAPPPRRAR